MRNFIRSFTYFSISFTLFCNGNGSRNHPYLFPFAESISEPSFQFEYGITKDESSISDSYIREETGGVCLHSLPQSLYNAELGAKFKVCLPANAAQIQLIKNGFETLEGEEETRILYQAKHTLWEAYESTFGKWQKDKRDQLPLESFAENRTQDGTISFSRFDLPSASIFQWSKDSCEVIFPSKRIGQTKTSSKILIFKFACSKLGIKETIIGQNEKWLQECVQEDPTFSEAFRHSDSPFGRFLEWENRSDRIICPQYSSIRFQDSATETFAQLDLKSLSLVKERYKLLLPHSVFVLTSNEQLNGVKISDSFLLNIGKNGFWYVDTYNFKEIYFNFKQGDEFFSRSTLRPSCRNQKQFYTTNAPSCLNPGLPNQLQISEVSILNSAASCSVSQIQITEFFSNSFSTLSIPSFVEIQNIGNPCDLSNLVLKLDEENHFLSAKEKVIQNNEVIIISREKWIGWNFQTIIKPISLKEFKFKIPYLSLYSLDSNEERKYLQDARDYILTNWNGITIRSILFEKENHLFPHPNENSHPIFSKNGYYLSPGYVTNIEGISFLDLPISEVLLSGTKDNSGSYPERFIEWSDTRNVSGFIFFQLESERLERFLFYKESNWQFPFIKSGTGVCLPPEGILMPDGSLPNVRSKISTLDGKGLPFTHPLMFFDYEDQLYDTLGLSGSSRISVHPESSPFLISISRLGSFGNQCSPHSEATPGKPNQKKNQIASNIFLSEVGLPNSDGFSFLEQPTQSSSYVLKNLTRIYPIVSYVFNQILDLTGESYDQIFSKEELIYLEWIDPSSSNNETSIFRLGEVRIEAVYPSPANSQNEWIYFCNTTNHSISTNGYLIEDEASSDALVPYSVRFPAQIPSFSSNNSIRWNESNLGIGDCAFVVDPDGGNWSLPIFAKSTDILLTVNSSQTIGNGISNLENLDLFKEINGDRRLISSYGKKNTPSAFQIPLKNLEYSLLKKHTFGNRIHDFQVFREYQ